MNGSKAIAVAATKAPRAASGNTLAWASRARAPHGPRDVASEYSKSTNRCPAPCRYHSHFSWLRPFARGSINAALDTSDVMATTVFSVTVECHCWSGRLLNLTRRANMAKKETNDAKSARLSRIQCESTHDSRGCFAGKGAGSI